MRLHTVPLRIVLIVITACLVATLSACSTTGAGTPANIQGRPAIQIAPDFILNDLQGQTVSLASLRGKVVVLNFWSTT